MFSFEKPSSKKTGSVKRIMIGGPQITVTAFSELGATSLQTVGTNPSRPFQSASPSVLFLVKKHVQKGKASRVTGADARQKFRIASENPGKQALVRKILKRHEGEQVLLIGLYIDQIKDIASELQIPLLTGTTAQRKRDAVYADFKEGRVKVLAVSKIANFAVDLPDASVAVQISGTFGSRQEEAQRLGRILRPKNGRNQAHFYNLVTRDTVEQDFALKRQLFLCEQGYEYVILDAAELS
ncbi:MAG: helicase-related protein [Syntrophales bacterium]|nr:helicase-related protein [Syntrophales bacterium]